MDHRHRVFERSEKSSGLLYGVSPARKRHSKSRITPNILEIYDWSFENERRDDSCQAFILVISFGDFQRCVRDRSKFHSCFESLLA